MAAPKPDSDSIHIQERDIALLRSLFESRIMTTAHIAALHFCGNKETAKKRLQKLKAAGFLGERKRRVYEPSILFLTPKSSALLKNHGVLNDYPRLDLGSLEKRARVSDFTVRHELEVMDVKAAFHLALRNAPTFSIAEFTTWPLLYQFSACRTGFGGGQVVVKPDGFIRILEKEMESGLSEHTFFLEVDRSTETQDTLISRAGCYLNYYKSGGFAVRNGAARSAYQEYPFRVLMVFKTAERRNNTAEKLLQGNPPIFTRVWLTTFEEVTANPLGAIWIRPVDYRDLTRGTSFDVERRHSAYGYRRKAEREFLVERQIKKIMLVA